MIEKENMKKILTIGRYFKSKYRQRVRKVPISLQGFTCPNIDGSVAKGGCTYCKNETFSPSLLTLEQSNITMNFKLKFNPILDKQVETLKSQFYNYSKSHNDKFGTDKYMMYFQSFSNTYAPYDTLKTLYSEALRLPNVVGLSSKVANNLLKQLGVKVKLEGVGYVTSQSISENTEITPGLEITLKLSPKFTG